MPTSTPMGTLTDVTLAGAAAVETLTLPTGARWLILWESTTAVSIVTKVGGTAAADGRLVPVANMPFQFEIAGYGFLGLAGAAAGTASVEIR